MKMRKVRKIKNVLPLLNLQYPSKVYVKQWQDNCPVPLGIGSVRFIITRFGDCEIDKCILSSNILNVYIK